jgi:hypothetical protein
MYHYVSLANSEVSGFGRVSVTKQEEPQWVKDYPEMNKYYTPDKVTYLIEDIMLFDQMASGGGTTIDKTMRAKFVVDFIRKHKKNPTDWYLWWHSHYNFGVSWSGTDESAISQLLEEGDENTTMVATCMNQQGHIIARRDTRKLHYDKMYVSIQPKTSVKKLEEYTKEVKKKVKPHIYKASDYKWEERNTNWYVNFIKEIREERTLREEAQADQKLLADQRNKPLIDATKPKMSMVTNVKGKPQTLYWDYIKRCFVDADGKIVTYEDISSGRYSTKAVQ